MRLLNGVLVGWLLLVVSGPSVAGKVTGLYQAAVPVARQDSAERDQGIATALTQVLIKVTGEARLEERPEVHELLRGAAGYVQQYRYEKRTEPPPMPDQPAVEGLFLHVQFDADAVNEALRRRGLPVWGDVRPSTLVWLAVEQGAQRYLIGADSAAELVTALQEAAARRGIPVLLPLLDLEDQTALSVADVWGNFRTSVFKASERYQPDAVLVGRLYRQGNGLWEAAWSFYRDGNSSNWVSSGAFTSQVLLQGVDGAADLLAARFAPIGLALSGGEFLLRVEAVDSLEDYAKLHKYLKGLQPVQSIRPDTFTSEAAQFRITLQGDYRLLQQIIGLTNQLQPLAGESGEAEQPPSSLPMLRYRWAQ